MKKKVKWILWALAGLIAVGYGLYTTFMPITVPVIKVKTSDVSQTFKEEGIVVAATENLIFSAFGGEIIYLGVEEGQQVKKGDILVRFSTDEWENQINQLVAQKTVYGAKSRNA